MNTIIHCAFYGCLLLTSTATSYKYQAVVTYANEARGLTVNFTAPTEFNVAKIYAFIVAPTQCNLGTRVLTPKAGKIVFTRGAEVSVKFRYVSCQGDVRLQLSPASKYKDAAGNTAEPCYDLNAGIAASTNCPEFFLKMTITNQPQCSPDDWQNLCDSKDTVTTPAMSKSSTSSQPTSKPRIDAHNSTLKAPSLTSIRGENLYSTYKEGMIKVSPANSEARKTYIITTVVASIISVLAILGVVISVVIYKIRYKNSSCFHEVLSPVGEGILESDSSVDSFHGNMVIQEN